MRRPQAGVVLLALMLMLLMGSIAAMAAADVWRTTRQREDESQLLFAGEQYRAAIRRYYFAAPNGTPRVLPARLEDLLNDTRYPVPVHHLRRLYADPITGSPEWGLVRVGDRIAGVHSLSEALPLKQTGFSTAQASFEAKRSYQEWEFVVQPGRQGRLR